jgi:carboxyl-terminal processing protease
VAAASDFQVPVKNNELPATGAKAGSSLAKFEVTDAILDDFKTFLRSKKVEFTDADLRGDLDFIRRRIKQEVFNSTLGLQEGFKVAIQGDNQVLKALEVMPEAKTLMATGRVTSASQPQK